MRNKEVITTQERIKKPRTGRNFPDTWVSTLTSVMVGSNVAADLASAKTTVNGLALLPLTASSFLANRGIEKKGGRDIRVVGVSSLDSPQVERGISLGRDFTIPMANIGLMRAGELSRKYQKKTKDVKGREVDKEQKEQIIPINPSDISKALNLRTEEFRVQELQSLTGKQEAGVRVGIVDVVPVLAKPQKNVSRQERQEIKDFASFVGLEGGWDESSLVSAAQQSVNNSVASTNIEQKRPGTEKDEFGNTIMNPIGKKMVTIRGARTGKVMFVSEGDAAMFHERNRLHELHYANPTEASWKAFDDYRRTIPAYLDFDPLWIRIDVSALREAGVPNDICAEVERFNVVMKNRVKVAVKLMGDGVAAELLTKAVEGRDVREDLKKEVARRGKDTLKRVLSALVLTGESVYGAYLDLVEMAKTWEDRGINVLSPQELAFIGNATRGFYHGVENSGKFKNSSKRTNLKNIF